MDIEFKDGVVPDDLKAITFRAIFAVAKVFENANRTLTITSTTEGQHMTNSYHYKGLAFDIRTWRIPKTFLPRLRERMLKALHEIDENFQVFIEETHIHVELDRRTL